MLDLILESDMKDNLYVKIQEPKMWSLDFFTAPPAGWVDVTSDPVRFSKDKLLHHLTMINVFDSDAEENPTDSAKRWSLLDLVFDRAGSKLVKNVNFTAMYIQAVFQAAFDEGVQYLEARASNQGLYFLDQAPEYKKTYGKHYINDSNADLWVRIVKSEMLKFQLKNPEFIGYSEIVAAKRSSEIKTGMQMASRLQNKHPDIVRGFDIVGQEDNGYSLLFFIEDFAEAETNGQTVPLYFHTGETNWPDDIMPSLHPDDPVGAEQNVYEAIILGAKRVGHGIGFIHHPYLMEVMKNRRIAVEANPVSNMLLGYVTDQRHHPAITYHRYGIPVVLGSDDPGRMGYDEFTVDWYEAFMAWGIGLVDMKQFANNSLQYSTMSSKQKTDAFTKWNSAWSRFIAEMKQEACQANLTGHTPEIHRIYPREGPTTKETNVRVFGRHFESGVCKEIICRFGNSKVKAQYVYNSMITCRTPQKHVVAEVNVSISFDGGSSYINSNQTFSYFLLAISGARHLDWKSCSDLLTILTLFSLLFRA